MTAHPWSSAPMTLSESEIQYRSGKWKARSLRRSASGSREDLKILIFWWGERTREPILNCGDVSPLSKRGHVRALQNFGNHLKLIDRWAALHKMQAKWS